MVGTSAADKQGKRLLLANPRGFCAGVVRAIEAVENAIDRFGAPVYVRRHIVHNQAVVDGLEAKGAIFIRELAEVPDEAVVILSAHGVPKFVLREGKERNLRIIDSICPLVAKVHFEVVSHYRAGRHVLLVGHQGHPEIVGTLGQLPPGAISVVSTPNDVVQLDLPPNTLVAFAVQTTFSMRDSEAVINTIKAAFHDVVGPRVSDVCYATTNRQAAIEQIAALSDHVLVIGDRISSNAKRLVEVAKAAGCDRSYLVSDEKNIPWSEIGNAKTVGLTSGASTPEESLAGVRDALERQGFEPYEVEGKQETTYFKPLAMDPKAQTAVKDPFQDSLARLRRDVDEFLCGFLTEQSGAAGRLTEAMRYAVVGDGKRLRALLTVTVAEIVGGGYSQAIRVASAIECVHAQSLIHDDLPCMDDDDLRRGKPSVHRQFDEATAVLAGDALLALAFEILSDELTHPDAGTRARLVTKLAQAIGREGLAAGQMMDLYPIPQPTRAEVFDCQIKKTGGLIRFAVEAGVTLGRCDGLKTESLLRYADKLGIAFQIRDDVLDYVGQEDIVGKKLRKDREMGRINAVHALGLAEAKRQTEFLAQECHNELAAFGNNAQALSKIADFVILRMH